MEVCESPLEFYETQDSAKPSRIAGLTAKTFERRLFCASWWRVRLSSGGRGNAIGPNFRRITQV